MGKNERGQLAPVRWFVRLSGPSAMLSKRRLSHAIGYLELGMLAEAAAELDRIPAAETDTLEFMAIRLAVLHEQKNWPAVRDLARELVGRNPTDAGAWVTWAYATRRAVSLEAAERILIKAEAQHPDEATIQFNLGCYASQRGDLQLARRRVDRAIALDQKFAEAAASDPDLAPLRAAEATDCQPGA
jgi:tetratricopeptide (TPR) repeat protein